MQSRPLKPRKSYPKRLELTISPPDPNTSLAHMLEMVGERKKVLDLGCASGYLASLMVRRECDVVGVDSNPVAVEEARKYCTSAFVADLDEVVLSELLEGKQFDAIVFGDVLEHLHEPARTLDESRALLTDGGYVVASIPNVSHGAIRLALLSGNFDYQDLGILDDAHLRFFTRKTIDELFLTTGFNVETIERVILPLFAESDLVPALDPRDFDRAAVAEVQADPESETLQFVIKAFPLSNDQRLRAVSKRFLTANTELATAKQRIAHREGEVNSLRTTLNSQEAMVAELRAKAERSERELAEAREECRRLENAHRLVEVDSIAKQNAAIQQTLVAQTELTRTTEVIAELRARVVHPTAPDVDEGEARLLREQLAIEKQRVSTITAEGENLSVQLVALQRELAEMSTKQGTAQRGLAEERQRAATRELQLADGEERRNELSERINELQSNLASVVERHDAARLELESERVQTSNLKRRMTAMESERDRELHMERVRVADLQQTIEKLEPRIGGFHAEVTALTQSKLELEESLQTALAQKAQVSDVLQAERARLAELQQAVGSLQLRADRLQAEVASLGDEKTQLSERLQGTVEALARTESDCADLVAEAADAIDAASHELQAERIAAEDQLRENTAKVADLEDQLRENSAKVSDLEDQLRENSAKASDLEIQLEAIREAAHADKLVIREYADEFRHRAERAEKELHGAIRQRDDLYLRVVDTDRVLNEMSERNSRLDEDLRQLKVRSEATIAELGARASSLENDLAHQQAVLKHLRESAESDRVRAEAAAGELASLTVRYEILQGNLAERDNLLVAQTEQLLAATSDERDRLLTLIDTVQSSHFWRLKHWLARLRSRLFGAAGAPK